MIPENIKILILEDNPDDVELLRYELKKSGLSFTSEIVQTRETFERALQNFIPDIILSDYSLPSFNGAEAFQIKQNKFPEIPFIIISGTIGEETVAELIRNGVNDYLLKGNLSSLPQKIRRSLKDTEEKKIKKDADEKLRKSTRLYAFISQINQNIAREKDEKKLFRNSCHIALEFGKFKMAWIGIFDIAQKQITLVEQSGMPIEYLDLFANVPYQNKGPQDHVLRTGTHFICNDIENDPELESWKTFAIENGIRSCIVLPIKKSGNIIGTFNVYAGEFDFFDKEEIKLLVEITGDISFALDLFKKVKKQKETEENLKQSEARLKEAQAIGHISNWDIDLLSSVNTWSDEFYKIMGIAKGDVHPSPEAFLSFIHPDDENFAKNKVQEAFDTLIDSAMNFRFIRKDGTTRYGYTEWRFDFDENGKPQRLYGILQDITELKKAEIELHTINDRLSFHIENTPLGFIEWDDQLHAKSWSKRAEEIFGWTEKEFVEMGKTGHNQVYIEDQGWVSKIAEQLVSGKIERNQIQNRNYTKDGTVIWCEWFNSVLKNEEGKVITIMSLVQDITEHKEAEKKLEQQNKELVKTNSELDRFVYSASHDLRSPLSSILGLVNFIEKESKEPDTLVYAKMIGSSINRLDEFIKNILSYSRNNRIEPEMAKIPLQKTVHEIVNSLRNMKEAEGIDFKVNIDERQAFYSDIHRFNTVMENIISNAIKYHIRDGSGRYIKVTGKSDKSKLHLCIEDNGIGIESIYHNKIFDMFFRLPGKAAGSGIGLYIVKEIIEKLQGSIKVNSTEGAGTSFTITLKNLMPL